MSTAIAGGLGSTGSAPGEDRLFEFGHARVTPPDGDLAKLAAFRVTPWVWKVRA